MTDMLSDVGKYVSTMQSINQSIFLMSGGGNWDPTDKKFSSMPIPGADRAKHMALHMAGMVLCKGLGICHDCKQPCRAGCMGGMWYPHGMLACSHGHTATPGHSCGCMQGGGSCCAAMAHQHSGLQQCISLVSMHPCSTRALQSGIYLT